MKILIVDDDPIFLDLIEQTLQSLGYTDLYRALSAYEALAAARTAVTPFDCFLLDIQMPKMNGIQLCAALREDDRYAYAPILMVTAMTEKHFVDEAFQSGASDYVTKPIETIEIKARMGMVEKLLSERLQTGTLQTQLFETEAAFGRHVAFDEPFILPEVPWVLPLSSLENYVLRLGNMRMFTSVAIGIHVKNARALFAATPDVEFIDQMSEIAVIISEMLPKAPSFLAYAGSGDFCAVIPRLTAIDPHFASMTINEKIAQVTKHRFSKQNRPQVRVGRPQSNGLFSFKDPSSVLDRAIYDARQLRTETKLSARRYQDYDW